MQNYNSKFKINLREKCYKFSLKIIALTNSLPNKRSAWIITDQLIRSTTSIGANLIEARSSSSRLEFKKFYEIALKSANETRYWLGILRDATEVDKKIINSFIDEAKEITNILGASLLTLKGKNKL